MKIGFCAKIDRIEEVAAAGYDYIELPVSAAADWTEEEYRRNLAALKASGLPVLAYNVLFPGEIKLLNPAVRDEEITGYLHHAFARVREMGGKTVVFGSGGSRKRPEDMLYDEAFRRLAQVARLIGETAAQYGITIVIEPLNRGETNMINSVAEGACLRAAVNLPNVQLLADYYHVAKEGHDPADLTRVGGIAHCHIATEIGREAPLQSEDGFKKLFSAMKQTNYQGLISVEGKCDDLRKDGPITVALLKKLWEEA
ncbi:MAG: sugar phosphate isomerase/epimerase [Clostridia bacterium]|nr:sugar phosphate isomerase/epimerase [Clostridia bacterium]